MILVKIVMHIGTSFHGMVVATGGGGGGGDGGSGGESGGLRLSEDGGFLQWSNAFVSFVFFFFFFFCF